MTFDFWVCFGFCLFGEAENLVVRAVERVQTRGKLARFGNLGRHDVRSPVIHQFAGFPAAGLRVARRGNSGRRGMAGKALGKGL